MRFLLATAPRNPAASLPPTRVPRHGTLRARLAAVLVAAAAAAPALAADSAAAPGGVDPAWHAADRAFDDGRFGEALAAYEALARRGDVAAARRAGELLLYGHGLRPAATPCDVWRAVGWLAMASAAGDSDARRLWAQAAGLVDAAADGDAEVHVGQR